MWDDGGDQERKGASGERTTLSKCARECSACRLCFPSERPPAKNAGGTNLKDSGDTHHREEKKAHLSLSRESLLIGPVRPPRQIPSHSCARTHTIFCFLLTGLLLLGLLPHPSRSGYHSAARNDGLRINTSHHRRLGCFHPPRRPSRTHPPDLFLPTLLYPFSYIPSLATMASPHNIPLLWSARSGFHLPPLLLHALLSDARGKLFWRPLRWQSSLRHVAPILSSVSVDTEPSDSTAIPGQPTGIRSSICVE